jgi:hypothetical protein
MNNDNLQLLRQLLQLIAEADRVRSPEEEAAAAKFCLGCASLHEYFAVKRQAKSRLFQNNFFAGLQ